MHTRNHPQDITTCKDSVDLLSGGQLRRGREIEEKFLTLNCVPNMSSSSLIPETYALATLDRSRSLCVFLNDSNESDP